jgi:hypothetical protein
MPHGWLVAEDKALAGGAPGGKDFPFGLPNGCWRLAALRSPMPTVL